MISKSEEVALTVAIANERIASEIVSRVIDAVPASGAAAQAILDVVKPSKKETKEIEEYLIVALTSRKYGKEIADQLDTIVKCLEWQAADLAANNAALNAEQAKLGALSKEAKEYLVVCMANRAVASSVSSKIDLATASAASIPDSIVV